LAALSGLAVQMLAILGSFAFVGLKLDEYYSEEGHNYFTLALSLVGVICSVVHVIKQVTQSSKQQ